MSQHEGAPQMTLGAGLAVWITAMVAIAGFAALGYFLKLAPLYAGFLFVWYWTSSHEGSFTVMPSTILGAVGGVATAGLLQYATVHWGGGGALAVLVLIAITLLVQIMNWLPMVINPAYMLFLTVTTAPLLQANESFAAVVAAILAGAAYFGLLLFVASRFRGGAAGASAAAAPNA
ncbi:hypothetical protein [uncultured Sphingomonas sp.]|jgi:hypothetical protein|uniref:hypothetical protein n=1 Tax=unclassified Sphingomonas TaxID=196159 RepID=UPI0025EE4268|nr:hypothetical protein [uncultured Sphingomonas sp.]